jgi:dolichol-phosphate mannosyltransferase
VERASQIQQSGVLLILPVLNERLNLEVLIPRLQSNFPDINILIVDDNSSDGTVDFVSELQATTSKIHYIRRLDKRGIGDAHLAGISQGIKDDFDFIITMDADLTHRVEDIDLFMGAGPEFDLVIGSRYLNDSNMLGWSIFRRLLTKGGHLATWVAFQSKLDMSSGMRRYRTDRLPLNLMERNCPPDYAFFFVSAVLFKALRREITQVPIVLNSRNSGHSKMSPVLVWKGLSLLFLFGLRIKRIKI